MVVCNGFSTKVHHKETVLAAFPFHDHLLPLSNVDLLLPAVDVGIFFCYKHTTKASTFTEMVTILKTSLAKVLVTYYPFAGEMVTNSDKEPELHCNNRGVDFLEAYADIELRDLVLYDPDETVEGKLVPFKKDGVLCVQATEFRCGGMVLSCTFDHRLADATSANMFLVAWAEIAQLEPISAFPSFNRSLLRPRLPLYDNDPLLDQLFVPLSSLLPPPENPPPPPPAAEQFVNRIYYIKADDIERIQNATISSLSGKTKSKLEAFTAYLWRIMAKGAHQTIGARSCSMGVVVDGRSKLKSMENYFGNVLSIPYGTLEVADLEAMGVDEVAEVLHGCVQGAATREHFLGLVNWVEKRRPAPALARVYCGPGDGVGEVAVVVSSGRRFPVEEVEFGWGKPVFGSYHFPWGGGSGYVMPMPSARGNGDWVVYVHLMRGLVEALEAEAGDVFRRMTAEYVMLAAGSAEKEG